MDKEIDDREFSQEELKEKGKAYVYQMMGVTRDESKQAQREVRSIMELYEGVDEVFAALKIQKLPLKSRILCFKSYLMGNLVAANERNKKVMEKLELCKKILFAAKEKAKSEDTPTAPEAPKEPLENKVTDG